METWGTLITGTLAVLATAYGTWATFKRGKQSDKVSAAVSKETNAIAWSAQLLGRLENVEKEVVGLRQDLNRVTRTFSTSINFLDRIMWWALGGCVGPMPRMPNDLREHFDPALVAEHDRQQSNPKK